MANIEIGHPPMRAVVQASTRPRGTRDFVPMNGQSCQSRDLLRLWARVEYLVGSKRRTWMDTAESGMLEDI